MPFAGRQCLASALYENERVLEFSLCPAQEQGMLGNIYVGIVENIQKNIGAAFVRIRPGVTGYLPLSEQEGAVLKTRKRDGKAELRQGDELLVQVDKEAMKQKPIRLTSNLSFSGRYLVLTTGKRTMNFSRKLESEDKKRLKRILFPVMGEEYGMIVRTNAAGASEEELCSEWSLLHERLEKVVNYGISRTCCSCIYQAPGSWIDTLKQYSFEDLCKAVTDVPEVCREITAYLDDTGANGKVAVDFYEDKLLPLHKLYQFPSLAERLRQRQVWLKSGGFLVIEQTEAFVAVDVNTGKYSGKKNSEETFHKINLEAAEEAARQIRLRQLSGTILIDFINMDRAEYRRELIQFLKKCVEMDPVKTKVIDMTSLQIAELTRTKERKSFAEQVRIIQNPEN